MHKKIIVLICLIIGVSLFCCLGFLSKNVSPQKTTIQFASWGSESEISILKPVLADFEKNNPDIKIDFMHIPQNYFQKIHLLFASNTAPDVVFINNHYLPVYARAGVLEDLSNNFDYSEFYPVSVDALSYDGKVYAVPRDVSNLVIFYNKDIFDKYNVSYPDKNWTLEDLLKISQKLTHLPEVFGISFEEEPLFYLPYLMSFGVKDFSDFDSKEMQEGLKFYGDLRNKYHTAPRKEESASATMAQMFLQGRVAMHLSGRWLVPKYREEAKFAWDIVRFPDVNGRSSVPADASGWAISKSSKHKQEGYRLVKYLSSRDSSDKFTSSGLIVPARVDCANSKTFLDGKKPQNSIEFLSIMDTASPTPVSADFKKVLDEMKTKSEPIFNKN